MKEMAEPVLVCVMSEGEPDEVVELPTAAEAEAYCDGVSRGASLYGAGSCYAVTEDGVGDLHPDDQAVVRRAFEQHRGK